eukprot:scaffold2739_cov257-Pinguiococcus_pyrenoidosus.AAC.25
MHPSSAVLLRVSREEASIPEVPRRLQPRRLPTPSGRHVAGTCPSCGCQRGLQTSQRTAEAACLTNRVRTVHVRCLLRMKVSAAARLSAIVVGVVAAVALMLCSVVFAATRLRKTKEKGSYIDAEKFEMRRILERIASRE